MHYDEKANLKLLNFPFWHLPTAVVIILHISSSWHQLIYQINRSLHHGMATPSMFQQHINANLIDLVEVGQVKARPIGTNFDTALGASTLGAGSVAIIVSPKAAILAHIAADATHLPYAYSGTDFHYVREMMDRLHNIYLEYLAEESISSPIHAVIVCAMFHNMIALAHQVDIIIDSFEDMGFFPSLRYYYISGERDITEQGTVLVRTNPHGGRPEIVVDGSPIQTLPPGCSAHGR